MRKNISALFGAIAVACAGLVGTPQASAEMPVHPSVQTASAYRLISVHVRKTVRTPHGYSYPMRVTHPRLVGPRKVWTTRFNAKVAAGMRQIMRGESESVDSYRGCADAALDGGWTGAILAGGYYASVLIDWNTGSCGGVSWDSEFASAAINLRTGRMHGLQYMVGKLGGGSAAANWQALKAQVRAQAGDCAETIDEVPAFRPAGWRVDSAAIYLAFRRYQIGYGACASPTYAVSWSALRAWR